MNSFEKIYKIVSKIPKGKVLTYKKVAELACLNPKASGARVVGFAMNANKDIIRVPCHRVVGSNGKLTGYARGGATKKREILEKEGVKFLDKNTVDIEKSLYKPSFLVLRYFKTILQSLLQGQRHQKNYPTTQMVMFVGERN